VVEIYENMKKERKKLYNAEQATINAKKTKKALIPKSEKVNFHIHGNLKFTIADRR